LRLTICFWIVLRDGKRSSESTKPHEARPFEVQDESQPATGARTQKSRERLQCSAFGSNVRVSIHAVPGQETASKPGRQSRFGCRATGAARSSAGPSSIARAPGALLLVALPLQQLPLLVLAHLLATLLDHASHWVVPRFCLSGRDEQQEEAADRWHEQGLGFRVECVNGGAPRPVSRRPLVSCPTSTASLRDRTREAISSTPTERGACLSMGSGGPPWEERARDQGAKSQAWRLGASRLLPNLEISQRRDRVEDACSATEGHTRWPLAGEVGAVPGCRTVAKSRL